MAYTAQVNLHDASIEALFQGPVRREVQKVVTEGIRVSKGLAPRHTGDLKRSIVGAVERRGAPDGQFYAWWGSGEEHAMWVHDGTGIYGPRRQRIRPRRAKKLVFRPYRQLGPSQKGTRRGTIPRKRQRTVAVTSVRGQARTPFLTEAFRIVMTANGVPFTIRNASLRSLPI